MLFLHGKLRGKKGYTVKVDFSHPTHIKLISDKEFKNYKFDKPYRFYGGFFEESPAYIPFPSSGIWHVVVEKGSRKNPLPVTAKIEVLKGFFTNENPPSAIKPIDKPAIENSSESTADQPDEPMPEEASDTTDSADTQENEEQQGSKNTEETPE